MVGMIASGRATAATPEPTPELVSGGTNYGGVVAEGRIVPERYADLAYKVEGEVAEIVVLEGGQVKAGDVIVRLKGDETLRAELTLAEQEMVDAQQALEDLKKNAGVEQAQVQQSIAETSEKVRTAKRASYYYIVPDRVGVYSLFEGLEKTHEKVEKACQEYEPYKEVMADSAGMSLMPPTFCVPQSLCRGAQVQSKDDPARVYKKKLEDAEGDFGIALTQMRNASGLAQAQAMLDKSQRDYEKVKDGINTDKLGVAEKRLEAAQWRLEAAEAALKDLELRAPFDGMVASVNIKVGERVKVGKSVVQVADESKWIVETNNLTEIQVVQVEEGQPVSVAADALPGVELKGVVEAIGDTYEEKDNDVIYSVKVALTEPDPRLRWGMTVVVTFSSK